MLTQSVALTTARAYLDEVRSLGVPVRRAILFGSFAKNTQHEWSDIDIALVADDFSGVSAFDKEPFRSVHIKPQFWNIETHTFPTRRFLEGDPFIEEIKKTGVEIFQAEA